MLISEQEIQKRRDYNANIMEVSEDLQKAIIPNKQLLVKLYYFEVETVTRNGVIEPRYSVGESEGGRPIARFDDQPFQARGVVVKVGEGIDSPVKVGDEVWVDPRIVGTGGFDFLTDRKFPVSKPNGMKLVFINQIEVIIPK